MTPMDWQAVALGFAGAAVLAWLVWAVLVAFDDHHRRQDARQLTEGLWSLDEYRRRAARHRDTTTGRGPQEAA